MSYDHSPEITENRHENEAVEQANFMNRVGAVAHNAAEWTRHDLPRYALAAGLAAVTLVSAERAIAQEQPGANPSKTDEEYYKEQEAIQEAKFPPITQIIDGAEPWFADDPNPVESEQSHADEIKRTATRSSIYGAEFKPTKDPQVLRLSYRVDPDTDVSGYGQLTRKVTVYTKKPGQDEFHKGGSFTIRNHQEQEAARRVRIANRLKAGGTLIARTKTTVSYEHLDGTTKTAVRRTPSTNVSK